MEGLFLYKYYYGVFNLELSSLYNRSRFYFFYWFFIKAVDKSVCATINDVNSLGEHADDYFFLLQIKKYTSHVYKNASPIQFRVRG